MLARLANTLPQVLASVLLAQEVHFQHQGVHLFHLVHLALQVSFQVQIRRRVPHVLLERPSMRLQQVVLNVQLANIHLLEQVHAVTVDQEPLQLKELQPALPAYLEPIQLEEARPVLFVQEVNIKVLREPLLVIHVQQAKPQHLAQLPVATAVLELIQRSAQLYVLLAQEVPILTS